MPSHHTAKKVYKDGETENAGIRIENFHSNLRYGILSWGYDGESKKIFKLQTRVIRLISKVGRATSCRELFKTLDLFPVLYIYIYNGNCLLHKIKHR
jgi:hypothetical protein